MFNISLITLCLVAAAVTLGEGTRNKRLLLDDPEELAERLDIMMNKIENMEETIQRLESGHGSTYIRWGRTVCEGNGTELVYTGYAGGNYYRTEGGAADYICLTDQPTWGEYDDAADNSAKVYGAEYQMGHQFDDGGEALFGVDLHQHDMPCAVCRTIRGASLMTPGTNQCAAGWTLEYWGYLVTGYEGNPAASNYACLDHQPQLELGDAGNENGKLIYVAEAQCGTLMCPPYVQNRELTCSVCSK